MSSKYKQQQRERAINLLREGSPMFRGASGGGLYRKKSYDYILPEYEKNLFEPIKDSVVEYFAENKIGWWGGKLPTANVLSSQVACVNHLFAIREDKETVLAMLQGIDPEFEDVLVIGTDEYKPAYIQFEAVSDKDYLNEGLSTRGSNCTSVDALVWAVRNGERWLMPIEWKYTEYEERDMALGSSGATRQKRYDDLINGSEQLKGEDHSCYYFEPFYQLMRQTLWAEQIVRHKEAERVKADNFLHLHIIPTENKDLLHKKYKCSGEGMEETWRRYLKDGSKYRIVSPEDLLKPIDEVKNRELLEYLKVRYW